MRPAARVRLSGAMARAVVQSDWPASFSTCVKRAESQILIVRSSEDEAIQRPSREMAKRTIGPSCAKSDSISTFVPSLAVGLSCQIRIRLSTPPAITRCPSGLKTTAYWSFVG